MKLPENDLNMQADTFLAGGGKMGTLIRSKDWSKTPLGRVDSWAQSLRSAAGIMLNSRYPIALYWGPDLALLYNDAWSPIPGSKHPRVLGRPAREVWPEIWSEIGPLFEHVFATGEGTWSEDQLLPMYRHGYTEECYFNFTFSPIRGDDGEVKGVFNAVIETTERVLGERRLRTLSDLSARVQEVRHAKEACERAARSLELNPVDVPFALIYLSDKAGTAAHLVATARIEPTHTTAPSRIDLSGELTAAVWPLRAVADTNQALEIREVCTRLGSLPGGPWPEPATDAIVLPLTAPGHQTCPIGFLIAGVNPRRRFDPQYRSFFDLAAGHIASGLTNARAYEEERARAEALAELDRAKTVFFSNVSHEFRTPLTLMLGPVEDALADAEHALSKPQRERLDVAHRNSLRLLKLVNTLLDFSRIEAGRAQASYEPTDLARFSADLASNFRSACERAGLKLLVDCPPLPESVYVDRDMWEKILLNLLSNAFKFTFEGEIAVRLAAVDGAAELSVRDTGVGIPEAELPRLFERFHRIEGQRSRTYEGSGIGLSLVQELVKLHGGTLRTESAVGQGTGFTVRIPLGAAHLPGERIGVERSLASTAVRAQAYVEEALRWLPDAPERSEAAADIPAPDELAPGCGARVLLADDNADMRAYVCRLLGEQYVVEAVADGEAALEAIRARRPDLVLADGMMPRLDGFGLLRTVREDPELCSLPVIMVSARAGEEARVEGLEAGADDYLVKPFAARELLARVENNLKLARVRQQATETLRESEARLRALVNASSYVVYRMSPDWGELRQLQGRDFIADTKRPSRSWLQKYIHPDDQPRVMAVINEAVRTKSLFELEHRVRRVDGTLGWTLSRAIPLLDANGGITEWFGAASDITERKRAEALQAAQTRALELIVEDAPLAQALDRLVRTIEAQSQGMLGSILLLDSDGLHLRHGAAPSLPEQYKQAIDGLAVGPEVGSCGAAAYLQKPVHVCDIATDPRWIQYRDLALSHGLRACWSTPIFSGGGELLGTFAMYYREAREPTAADLALVDIVTRAAALIIERKRTEAALQEEAHALAVLDRIGRSLSAELDLERLVQAMTDAATEISGAAFGSFFYNVIDEHGETYMLYTLSGAPREAFPDSPMPRNTTLFAPTFAGTGVVRLDDVRKDPRFGDNPPYYGMPPDHLPVCSYLAVPVSSRSGEVLGGLFFGHPEPGVFTARAERMVVGIATQAAIAIDNARLYQAAQREIAERRQAEQLLLEHKRLLEMIALGRPLDECLASLCATLPALNPHTRASILIANEERRRFPRSIAPDLLPSFGEGLKDAPINDLAIGTCGEAVFRGEPVTCPDIANDPKWSQPWRDLCIANGILACHSTPIPGVKGFPLGSFMLCFDEPRAPGAWEQRLAAFGTHIASIALERDRSSCALRESEQRFRTLSESLERRVEARTAKLQHQRVRLRRLAGELTSAEQRERRRLAAVLHDGLQQLLVAAKIRLGQVHTQIHDPAAVSAAIERVVELLEQAVDSAHDLTRGLRPPVLYEGGLIPALRWLASELLRLHDLRVVIDAKDTEIPLSDDSKALLFEAVRELLFNVVKHAGIKEATVRVRQDEAQLQAAVEDNGVGFDVEAITQEQDPQQPGLGLFSIRERLAARGGGMVVESSPSQGTRIRLTVRLTPA
ncbi:MAG TPA: GAF domain-containing protein, partial [Nitrococcus sp.]|nr:GAF domain-containing protein [Nitrococcus sp.]